MTQFNIGDPVTVELGAGIDSGKKGHIVSHGELDTRNMNGYSLHCYRKSRSKIEVVQYEDNTVDWMYRSRLIKGHYDIRNGYTDEFRLSQLIGKTVTIYPFFDTEQMKPHKVTGKLSNHKPGIYQVTGDYLGDGEFDSWVFSLVEVQRIRGDNIYLYQ